MGEPPRAPAPGVPMRRYAEQIERGWAGTEVHTWTDAITRHLHEATTLLDS